MKTIIKYNELNELSKYLIQKSDEVDLSLQNIGKLINSLEGKWKGKDCEEFIKQSNKIIINERVNNKKIRQFGNDLNVVSNDYLNIDNKWLGQVKRGGNLNNE